MHIGVPRETRARETRVAATPETVAKLVGLGYDVVVESGAGNGSSFPDEAYAEAGAAVGTAEEAWGADVVLRVNAPATDEIGRLRDGAVLVSLLSPALNPDLVEALAQRPITVLAMDAVPRISRAQSLDVLSSMANIAGYRAVIEAAHTFGRFFTGQVTAAGKVPAGEGARRRRRCRRAGGHRRGAAASARSCAPPTSGRRSPSRCARSAASTSPCRPASRRSAPTATRARWARTSTGGPPRCTPSRCPTSTSSSPPR